MKKLYLAPTVNRSCDMPANLRHLLMEEECSYRATVSQSQIDNFSPEVPEGMIESMRNGTDKVTEIKPTIDGDETYHSWDHAGVRYYIEIEDFERDVEALILATGLRVVLERRDHLNEFQQEFLETIYGMPMVSEEDWCGEIETDHINLSCVKVEEGEEWRYND